MSTPPRIPSIEQLRQRPAGLALAQRFGHHALIAALRQAADVWRARLFGGESNDGTRPSDAPGIDVPADLADAVLDGARVTLERQAASSLVRVINATGVIIHTNLGRAPLAEAALARVVDIAAGYASLEYDLAAGTRGSRTTHAEPLLRQLTGAEAAVVVNNNAAATMLMLATLAAGREVVVSRGELVEIGGGFRVPDILGQSGAILREVGTTNRTRVSDYGAAIGSRTALILRVHPSNFRIEGFTQRPSVEELVALGRTTGVAVVEDLGSGFVTRGHPALEASGASRALAEEPTVQSSILAGVDVVGFSGDKLLGGPQAGILVGRAALIDRMRRHPLMRALRCDKLTYAALEATLVEHLSERASSTVPVVAMLSMTADEIRSRAERVASQLSQLDGLTLSVVEGQSTVGGGSAPGVTLQTALLQLQHARFSADTLAAKLRETQPPVIGRIANDAVVLDMRTVLPTEDAGLVDAVTRVAESR